VATTVFAQAVLEVKDRPRKPYFFIYCIVVIRLYQKLYTIDGNVLSVTKNVAI